MKQGGERWDPFRAQWSHGIKSSELRETPRQLDFAELMKRRKLQGQRAPKIERFSLRFRLSNDLCMHMKKTTDSGEKKPLKSSSQALGHLLSG